MDKVPVTEETFFIAVNNCHPHTRSRLFKKMAKIKHRAAEWVPDGKPKFVESPINGNRIDVTRGMVERKRLPPSDLEVYVDAFVQNNYYKAAKNEKA